MIYCPKCGTANRRGSRFCNECGAPLPMRTALRCPMCGATNPIGNAYCDKCGARLIPMTVPPFEESGREQAPIKGLSLPTIPLEEKQEQQVEDVAEGVGTEERETEDWLTQLRASTMEEAEEPETTTEPIEPVEIPDWLRDLGPVSVKTQATPGEEQPTTKAPLEEALAVPSPAVGEITERLQELVPAEVPDWLREMAPPEGAPPQAAPPAAEAAPEEAIPATPAPAPAEVPDWLREMAPPEGAPPQAAPPAAKAAPTEVPEWLSGLEAEPAPPSAPTTPAFEGVTPLLPPEPGTGVAEAEGLARAEIPGWLEVLRPRPEATEAPAEEGPLETEGLLEGLRGVIPPTLAIEVPAVRESALSPEISEVSVARAQLLQSLLARPVETPRPTARKRGISMGERAQRWLVAAVLVIAVGGMLMAPLIIPREDIPTLTKPAEAPEAGRRIEFQRLKRMHDVIQDVHAGDAVLVAFEYGPAEAEELNLVAEPILRHLLDQGAHISVVSTRPEGKTVAARLLSGIIASEERYTETQYARSDYRPGGATGVSQLLTNASTPPHTPPELILVLTAQPGPLRWWVEQSRLQARGEGAPAIVAGLSAALEPAASPYLDVSAGQLEGAINGLGGAAAYEMHRGSAGRATQRLNALAVGHIAIVGLMTLGAVLYALGGSRRRKK